MDGPSDHSRLQSASFSQNNWSTTLASTAAEPSFQEPEASRIFSVVFFSLTTVASLLGNSIMLKATREYPSRKPVSYLLVANLAVAELVSTVFLPFNFFYFYLDRWPFGQIACTLAMPIQVVSVLVVTTTLAAIAAYRFGVFQLKISMCSRRVPPALLLLWLVSLAFTMPLFIFNKLTPAGGKVYCDPFDDFPGYANYEIARFVLNFGLPYLIMVLSYAAVAFKLKRNINRRTLENTEMSELGQASKQSREDDASSTAVAKRRKSSRTITDLENDLLKMFYAIIVVFAVCYFPYQVQYLFYIFGGYDRYPEVDSYQSVITRYSLLLASLSSALHPVCYGTMSTFYARAFSRLVLCR